MSSRKVAIKYAQTLLETSIEKDSLDAIANDVNLALTALRQNPNFIRMLKSPIVKLVDKQTILDKVFQSRVSAEFYAFINFLILKGREAILDEILECFEILKNEQLGIAKVELTTSVEVDEVQLQKIKITLEKLLSKTVVFSKKIDASIIGGFVAKVDDKIYDASVKNQLELMKKQLVNGAGSI
jgi:F-type H+-transporting ATPase subunit delta